jgi:hypothetical protein
LRKNAQVFDLARVFSLAYTRATERERVVVVVRFTSKSASSVLHGLLAVVIAVALPLSADAASKPAKKRAAVA